MDARELRRRVAERYGVDEGVVPLLARATLLRICEYCSENQECEIMAPQLLGCYIDVEDDGTFVVVSPSRRTVITPELRKRLG